MARFILLLISGLIVCTSNVSALPEEAPPQKVEAPKEKQTAGAPWSKVSLPKILKIQEIPKSSPVPQPIRPPAAQTADIAEVQRQIGEMIRLHETLKAAQVTQTAGLQRMVEQSKVHRQILQDLEAQRQARAVRPAGDWAVEQKKARLIRKELKKRDSGS